MANVLHTLSSKVKSLTDRNGDKEKNGSISPPSSSSLRTRRSFDLSRTSIDKHRSSQDEPRRSMGSGAFLADHHINSTSSSSMDKAHGKHSNHVNTIKSAGLEVANKLHLSHHRKSSSDLTKTGESDEMSKNQMRKHEKLVEVQRKRDMHTAEEQAIARHKDEEQKMADRDDLPEMLARYGTLPINNYAGEWKHTHHVKLLELTADDVGKEVIFRARLHNVRKMSAKLVFFILRQQTATIQSVLQQSDMVSKHMVYWAEHIPIETVVLVRGIIQAPKAKEGEVTGASLHDKEVLVHELFIVSKLTDHLPFTVNEAEVTEQEAEADDSTRHHVSDRARLQGRILDLRTTASQAIFRIQSGICGLFRSYLDSQGFIEIHSPKLQGGATESGASVFKVAYFDRTAFLAQSPQLAKQMSIAADFGRVYEIGAVFRAENSNTHRHLTEYTGLDIEMAIDEHYHEARNLVDRTLKSIFAGVYANYRPELEVVKRQFPHEDLVWLEQTPIFRFKDAIAMLNETGWVGENGKPLPLDEDLGTRDEIQLGRVVKEKYGTDYYIMDKFPASARPFYTMPDPSDPTYTNSFDIFVRGQEIVSGGQRVHDAEMLKQQMIKAKVDPGSMEEYMQGFEWGAPPHAGAGIGLERLLMLLLKLGDIRHASMYPRDPKSLPAKPKVLELRHPEASTLHPPWEGSDQANTQKELQPLEKLIANYGDASNTSWLEPRFEVWRHPDTGAAVGYVPHQGYAITIGDPLCHMSQYTRTIATYLNFIKHETGLKLLWLLCGPDVEEILSTKFDWRTFSVAAEQRLDLSPTSKAFSNPDVQRKIRHAAKEGIHIHDIPLGHPVPPDLRQKIDTRITDWLRNRKDHQHVHLTDVHPWQDSSHRTYHYATARDGSIAALVVLAQLSPAHGWQVKFSLDFALAPSGSIEATVVHALKTAQAAGAAAATFGAGASSSFSPGRNLKGAKVKMLSKAYHTISTELKLTQKSEFREKLGAEEDPIYVCYPPKGLGPRGVHAIMSFFED